MLKTGCALSNHAVNEGHVFDFGSTSILDRDPNYYNRLFLEMYNINFHVDTVNFRTDIDGLSKMYTYLINIDKKREGRDMGMSTLRS